MDLHINEIPIKGLNNEPAKFKKHLYPLPYQNGIQKPYFICISAGVRGSGKTFAVVKMLSNQEKSGFYDQETHEKVDIRHVLFSPTVEANPIFSSLKYLDEDEDIHNDFTEEKLLDVLEDIKNENEKTKEFKKYKIAYEKYKNMTLTELSLWDDYESFALLYSKNFMHWNKIEKPKYPNGCVCNIILDDCLASGNAFANRRKNLLVKTVLNSRHIGVNVIICAQNIKAINKSIRANTDIWMLFKFRSMKIILEDLYTEISGLLSPEEFEVLFEYATAEPHNFLCLDFKESKRENQVKLNLDTILQYKNF
jgi:hypothetical protein